MTVWPASKSPTHRGNPGFSLIELLVVIAIIGVIAGLAAPAFKTKTASLDAAHRQLSDDLNRARQLAISTRSTVYVLFVPLVDRTFRFGGLTLKQKDVFSRRQLKGYTIYSERSVGAQPGQREPRFLSEWRQLPDGVCVLTNKFEATLPANETSFAGYLPLDSFDLDSGITVPIVEGEKYPHLPYIAFDPTGALTLSEKGRIRKQIERINPGSTEWKKDLALRSIIPVVSAAVVVPKLPMDRTIAAWEPASVTYKSPNDLGGDYRAITNFPKWVAVDPLTGRSRVEAKLIDP